MAKWVCQFVILQVHTSKGSQNEWMNEESWMRGQQTCPLTIHILNMWTVSSDVSIQRRHWEPLSVHLWSYCIHPTRDVNDVVSEGWPQHRGLRPLLFSNSGMGSFTSHKNQVSVSALNGTYGFSSLSEKTKSLIVCRCYYKGSTFGSLTVSGNGVIFLPTLKNK